MNNDNATTEELHSQTKEGDGLRTIVLKTMTPSHRDPFDFSVKIRLTATILDLKSLIKDNMDSHPEHSSQRIIYQGRQLTDSLILRDVVGAAIVSYIQRFIIQEADFIWRK